MAVNYGFSWLLNRLIINRSKIIKFREHFPIIRNFCAADKKVEVIELQNELKRKITLVNPNSSVVITTLGNAYKVADNESLRLVKIIDRNIKTHRPVYQLMTKAQYIEGEIKSKRESKIKSKPIEKLAMFNINMANTDQLVKIHKIVLWLSKKRIVRVVITGKKTNLSQVEEIYKLIEEDIKEFGSIVEKQENERTVEFLINPKNDECDGDNLVE